MSVADFEAFCVQNPGRHELRDGEIVAMSPANWAHGWIAGWIHHLLLTWGGSARRTQVAVEAGFVLRIGDRTLARAADVVYFRDGRAPAPGTQHFVRSAPDLAVEIASPANPPGEMPHKAGEWLSAGCEEVWIVEPTARTVAVYRKGAPVRTLSAAQTLTSADLLPGFTVPVADLFPPVTSE